MSVSPSPRPPRFLPFILTGGGPINSTLFYNLYVYDNAFKFLKMGYASALAWILFLIVLARAALIIFFRLVRLILRIILLGLGFLISLIRFLTPARVILSDKEFPDSDGSVLR